MIHFKHHHHHPALLWLHVPTLYPQLQGLLGTMPHLLQQFSIHWKQWNLLTMIAKEGSWSWLTDPVLCEKVVPSKNVIATQKAAHHFLMKSLQMFVALVHIIFRSSQGHHITLLPRVWKGYLNLIKFLPDFSNVFSSCSNDSTMESLLYDDVSGSFILL